MKVRVLGCSGAIAKGLPHHVISCSITMCWSMQGTGVGDLTLDEMRGIDHVLLTHSHLDHVAALPLMVDAIAAQRTTARSRFMHCRARLMRCRAHIFNNTIWPDFSTDSGARGAICQFSSADHVGQTLLLAGKLCGSAACGAYCSCGRLCGCRSVPVAGSLPGTPSAILALWARINQLNVAMLVIETAFSNRERDLARAQFAPVAPCPRRRARLHRQGPKNYPIYITHTKPAETDLIMAEIQRFDQTAPFGPNVTHDIRWLRAGQEFEL